MTLILKVMFYQIGIISSFHYSVITIGIMDSPVLDHREEHVPGYSTVLIKRKFLL